LDEGDRVLTPMLLVAQSTVLQAHERRSQTVPTVGGEARRSHSRASWPTPSPVRGADDNRSVPERDDGLDEQMYLLHGIAVSWCQQLETALVHLLDAHQHDTARPLEERWATVSKWLDQVAGQLVKELGVSPEIETDLKAAIGRRNRLVHDAWRLYYAARISKRRSTYGSRGCVTKPR
jgi:hypothetical protein